MSMAEGAACDSKEMGERPVEKVEERAAEEEEDDGKVSSDGRDDDLEDDDKLDLGPRLTLKHQMEMDKEDDSLRRWKEKLLGSLDFASVGEKLEPEVKILRLTILSPGRPEITLFPSLLPSSKGSWFTLREGSHYRLKFSFSVSHNIVSGLRYSNSVWKAGVKVDSTKEMLGTFSPRAEPYDWEMPEETTPSGIFARGSYSARSKGEPRPVRGLVPLSKQPRGYMRMPWLALHLVSLSRKLRRTEGMASRSIVLLLILLSVSATTAQTSPSPSPSPAPAPSPGYVNLTHLLSLAGPFTTFLGYLEKTHIIDTFQSQANNSDQGITIFVPTNDAFSSLKNPSLSKLTEDQLRSLLLFHALPQYYSLEEFKNLSQKGPASTFAGGQYTLNFTYEEGLVRVLSGWASPMISSSIFSTEPVALYQVKRVLLPEAIFGVAPPAAPAPAPAPEKEKPSDLAAPAEGNGSSSLSPKGSLSGQNGGSRQRAGLAVVLVAAMMLFW